MNLNQLTLLENLRTQAPMPWVLDQDNASGVVVKDGHGDVIFYEDFGSIPDEAPSHVRVSIITRASTLARFLVALSGNPL